MYMYIYSVSRFTRLCFQDVRVTWRQAFTIEVFMSPEAALEPVEAAGGEAWGRGGGPGTRHAELHPGALARPQLAGVLEAFEERGEVLHYRVSGHPPLGECI